ncbi:hypothetical protein E2R51_11955 [Jeotgalibacillus sp. S-D1]|uniref:saccharopine dehydrogenase family protein n=1 Tax=Jeotgalibacillus sp. S-D1 TaxID=2552189 RepID=UPI00105A348C|nr:saccharopine dehydrogenase NADP-binding domain-containing protein [Jeotgalibacillus sp. S-D1]TDL31925.1 hypothetical protein E2R51_11955 [Jeotgalibacillus sp. S-D1]
MSRNWMIYGANGYTGELIARKAVQIGMIPVLAGRSFDKIKPLANELALEARIFSLEDSNEVKKNLGDIDLVIHCAGPFSITSAQMIEGCLAAGTHYLDITGEAEVFEHTHSSELAGRAERARVVLCSGVGFDVIPTDCTALKLKEMMPDATHLSLGFQSDSGVSPGTYKTMIQGLATGSLERLEGRLTPFPLGTKHRKIDFGKGPQTAMAIPWGDVSTAFYTTGIPNINTWIPMSAIMIRGARIMQLLRPLLGNTAIQGLLKKMVEKKISGPDELSRGRTPAYIWGEARNEKGDILTARIQTANVYSLTADGALAVAKRLLDQSNIDGGSWTPAGLFGADFIEELPGSGKFELS